MPRRNDELICVKMPPPSIDFKEFFSRSKFRYDAVKRDHEFSVTAFEDASTISPVRLHVHLNYPSQNSRLIHSCDLILKIALYPQTLPQASSLLFANLCVTVKGLLRVKDLWRLAGLRIYSLSRRVP